MQGQTRNVLLHSCTIAVLRVAKQWEACMRKVTPDLVRPASHRLCPDECGVIASPQSLEARLRRLAMLCVNIGAVARSPSRLHETERCFDGASCGRAPANERQVGLAHLVSRKLQSQGSSTELGRRDQETPTGLPVKPRHQLGLGVCRPHPVQDLLRAKTRGLLDHHVVVPLLQDAEALRRQQCREGRAELLRVRKELEALAGHHARRPEAPLPESHDRTPEETAAALETIEVAGRGQGRQLRHRQQPVCQQRVQRSAAQPQHPALHERRQELRALQSRPPAAGQLDLRHEAVRQGLEEGHAHRDQERRGFAEAAAAQKAAQRLVDEVQLHQAPLGVELSHEHSGHALDAVETQHLLNDVGRGIHDLVVVCFVSRTPR
mmetsp:Transcript_37288/g.107426  ORF Transcript_37288/g.107426 Transcript_37288/m.107426 type:complete len:378 (-) Transcript_37288:1450-2583(-)